MKLNGNLKIILTLVIIIVGISGTVFSLVVWGSITENRKDIKLNRSCISLKFEDVIQRLSRIEAKLEK